MFSISTYVHSVAEKWATFIFTITLAKVDRIIKIYYHGNSPLLSVLCFYSVLFHPDPAAV